MPCAHISYYGNKRQTAKISAHCGLHWSRGTKKPLRRSLASRCRNNGKHIFQNNILTSLIFMPHDTSHARAPEPDSDSWEEVDLGLDEVPSADEVAKKAAEQIEASMPPELRDQAEEAVQEIIELSPKEKKSLFGGLANIGYWANQKKALLLSGVADRLEKKFTPSAVRRLLTAASESYRKDAVRAQKAMDNPKVFCARTA